MVLLPVADPLGVLLIPEIILVLRFSQPGSLRLSLAGFSAIGFQAIALALSVSIIGKKKFLAVQAFASGLRWFHWFQNQEETSIGNRHKQVEENPPGRRLTKTKKEEDFSADASKKTPSKKIHFQTGGSDPFSFHRWQAGHLSWFGPKWRARMLYLTYRRRWPTECS